MNKLYLFIGAIVVALATTVLYHSIPNNTSEEFLTEETHGESEEEGSKQTRIGEMMKQQFELTKDPALGYPTTDKLLEARDYVKRNFDQSNFQKNTPIADAKWQERGPLRTGGRTRTMLLDANDPTDKTMFAAGVAGGLWKTDDVTATTVEWYPINDYLENMAIVTLVQNPNNPQEMYFGTGEAYFNADAVRGAGVFRSTDGGNTWAQLPATANWNYVMRMAIHPNGDIYAVGSSIGVQRSQDGGQTWTKVLGAGVSTGQTNSVNEIEIASDGTIYAVLGYRTTSYIYRSLNGTSVGDIGNWEFKGAPINGLIGAQDRIEITSCASAPNVVYALTSDTNFPLSGSRATTIHKTIDGGDNWVKTADAPEVSPGNGNFAGNQAWFDLEIAVDPTDPDRVIVGGIDIMMSVNGGSLWAPITSAYTGAAPYAHPDQHLIYFHPNQDNVIFFGNDGGLYRTYDGNKLPQNMTLSSMNRYYNVTQFYACAMHPDAGVNYFLGGTQDNNSLAFEEYGISDVRVVRSGDGAFCHIDQNEPNIQIVSSQNGNYGLSTNGGVSFPGGASTGPGAGFINPSDYDNDANIMYARAQDNGDYFRWTIPATTENVTIIGLLGAASHVSVSPNVANRVYFGTSGGRLYRVDDAHTGTSKTPTTINIPTNGTVSSIAIEEGNEQHLLVTLSNYGINNVWESTDEGLNWTSVEGNLPNMPVRWGIFNPTNTDQAMLATEAGVWVTNDLDAGNTSWVPNLDGMPLVRVDMLQYRTSDNLVLAATHGRGMFTTDFLAVPDANFRVEQVGYTGKAFQFENRSINPTSFLWNFGDGTTSTEINPSHVYNTLGSFTVQLKVNDTVQVSKMVTVLPNRSVPYTSNESNYQGDFEGNIGDFAAYSESGTIFELGNSTISGKSGTKSGDNAWVTGLTEAFYEHDTEAYLYTSNFDLTQEGIYEMSFWAKYEIQFGWDGFQVQYSTDKGNNWQVLGTEDTGWYNYSNDATPTGFSTNSSYFTGITSNSYRKYLIDLGDFIGNEVAFRFAFKTNNAGSSKGLAIDDFQIEAYQGELKTVLRSFEGEFADNNTADIRWTTLPEYQCEGFDLEISENGKDFTFYGDTDGQGNSISPVNYINEPGNLRQDLYYFRLKVKNLDSTFFYSDVIVLQRRPVALDIFNIYPNPFTTEINFAFNAALDQAVTVRLYDSAGKLMYENSLTSENGVLITIPTENFAVGMYFLEATVGDDKFVRKLIKH